MPAYVSLLDFVGDDWGTGCDIGNARECGGNSGSKSRTLDGIGKGACRVCSRYLVVLESASPAKLKVVPAQDKNKSLAIMNDLTAQN